MAELKTKIGLEIHVQLATASKMFCRCSNFAENVKPNTLVCPVCLGLPGSLPVANKQAIEWTIKTGLALNCDIPAVAKFDRKHYFYPDLPKGYQISQYDEPFCKGGWLEVHSTQSSVHSELKDFSDLEASRGRNDKTKIRLNRIHLEEDAGKLIHRNGDSLVDLNRAGTPLMEIVTEPDITTPAMAGDFLRHLQKIVRDVVEVSEASMEKGHLRCDANISVNSDGKMSQIIEIKNLNSFRFVEKALAKAEEKLKNEFSNWPAKLTKETWGYNSDSDSIYLQRTKEEAADYRYFPEPDLPPIKSEEFDLVELKNSVKENEETKIAQLIRDGVAETEAKVLVTKSLHFEFYRGIASHLTEPASCNLLAKAIVHRYFPFEIDLEDIEKANSYSLHIVRLKNKEINKIEFGKIAQAIHDGVEVDFNTIVPRHSEVGINHIIEKILAENPAEVARYKKGETKLLGFFVGTVMKETKGSADPQLINSILKEKL